MQKGVRMYQCRDCMKWSGETTGIPLYEIKLKTKWQSYLRCMEQVNYVLKLTFTLGNKGSKDLDRRLGKRGSDFKRNKGKEDITVVHLNKLLSFSCFLKQNAVLIRTWPEKAMLLFYEKNNVTARKGIFSLQFEFAVKTCF